MKETHISLTWSHWIFWELYFCELLRPHANHLFTLVEPRSEEEAWCQIEGLDQPSVYQKGLEVLDIDVQLWTGKTWVDEDKKKQIES